MMGEAIAKPVLTILSLAVEELSCLQYNGLESSFNGPMPRKFQRAVHIGGDDHIARGPRSYLNRITENFLKSGSVVSPNKHGISKIMVRYTEKILYVENFRHKVLFKDLDEDRLDLTPAIDSVKVRLLTKSQSTMLKKDDRNVAIGKAFQLMRTLKYIADRPFSTIVRDLFISRMRPLLPSKVKSPKIWHMMFLPKQLGGLSLAFDDEVESHFRQSPFPIRSLLWKIKIGKNIRPEGRLLRKLTSNPCQRGITALQERTLELQELMEDGVSSKSELESQLPFKDPIKFTEYSELVERFSERGNALIRKLESEGIFTHHRFIERYLRGNIFMELLVQKPTKRKVFETAPYLQRYLRIKDELIEDLPDSVTEDDISAIDFNEVFNRYMLDRIIFVDENQEVLVEKEIVPGFFDTHKDKLANMSGVNVPSMKVHRYL
jgi:hypothetical protein